jgi:hypothetical protein
MLRPGRVLNWRHGGPLIVAGRVSQPRRHVVAPRPRTRGIDQQSERQVRGAAAARQPQQRARQVGQRGIQHEGRVTIAL